MPVRAGDGWVPLTDDTWLEAEDQVTCEALYLAQALRTGLGPVDELYRLLMLGLQERYRREDHDEVERLRLREDVLKQAFTRTLARQASVLDTAEAATTAADDDDLLAACRSSARVWGSASGSPRPAGEGKLYEPVAAIARTSHVRYRSVALDGGWWSSDHGPLLAFSADDDAPVALLPASSRSYRALAPQADQAVPVDAAYAAR